MLPSAESIQIILPILSILFLALGFLRPVYGVIAYFIALNGKLGEMYPALASIRFELVCAIIAFLSIFLRSKNLSKIMPKKDSPNNPFWLYFLLAMLSIPQSVNMSVSWQNGGYTIFKLMLFYVMVIASISSSKDLSKMVWAMVLMTFWVAYEPIANYSMGVVRDAGYGSYGFGRFGAASGHVALANGLSQGIPMTYFWAIGQTNKTNRMILFMILAVLIIGVVISKSRGGFVGLVAIAAAIFYVSKNKKKMAMVLFCCFIFLLPLAGKEYLDRISTIQRGLQSRSTSDRYLGLVHGVTMFTKRPLLGVGIGCYAEARRKYFRYYFFSHNLYGEVLGELGLGSVAWAFWIYMIFKSSNFIKKRLKLDHPEGYKYYQLINGIQVGLFTRLVIGNFSHCQLIWFWFLMAAFTICLSHLIPEHLFNDKGQDKNNQIDDIPLDINSENQRPISLSRLK